MWLIILSMEGRTSLCDLDKSSRQRNKKDLIRNTIRESFDNVLYVKVITYDHNANVLGMNCGVGLLLTSLSNGQEYLSF